MSRRQSPTSHKRVVILGFHAAQKGYERSFRGRVDLTKGVDGLLREAKALERASRHFVQLQRSRRAR